MRSTDARSESGNSRSHSLGMIACPHRGSVVSSPSLASNPSQRSLSVTERRLLDEALERHRQGQLETAVTLYDRVITVHATHVEALRFRALALAALGRSDAAVASARAAVAAGPASPEAHFTLGNLLAGAGNLTGAIGNYRAALKLKPRFGDALCNLGSALAATEAWAEAAQAFRAAIALTPQQARLHNNLSIALHAMGEHEAAAEAARRATKLEPSAVDGWNNLGIALKAARHLPDAITAYERAVALQPHHRDALYNLGLALTDAGKFAQAEMMLQRAVAENAESAPAQFALGSARLGAGKWTGACAAYRDCVRINPQDAHAWHNLALALRNDGALTEALAAHERGLAVAAPTANEHVFYVECLCALQRWTEAETAARSAVTAYPESCRVWQSLGALLVRRSAFAEAEGALRKAVALAPADPGVHGALGNVFAAAGRPQEAIASYRTATQLDPTQTITRTNAAMIELLLGDFEQGWRDYETRSEAKRLESAGGVRWHAEQSLAGHSILIHAEQGLGDALQFARYLPLVRAQAERVVFVVHPPLQPLLAGFAGTDAVIAYGELLPICDYVCPLLSLPFEFRTRLDSTPPVVRPERAGARAAVWAERLPKVATRRIGFVWSGRPTHVNDHNRSIPLATFRMLFDGCPEFAFFSLQKDPAEEDARLLGSIGNVHNVGPEFADFVDTAGCIENLDLVVTVDTSVAHLAATLGKPTWILLPAVPDFRWLLERNDSPWYPSVTLFRQTVTGSWVEPLETIIEKLRAWPE